jgi:hypothetical protein
MKTRRPRNNIARFVSCIFLMLALAWLTVSLPIVYYAQQVSELAQMHNGDASSKNSDDKSENPFANTTEEKTSNSGSSLSEEYLHEAHASEQYITILSVEYKIEHYPTYIAFYGELVSPPPDQA